MDIAQLENAPETFEPSGLIMCDACFVARAYVKFTKEDSDWFLCNHHATVHELVLVSSGHTMIDRRDVLEAAEKAFSSVNPDDDNF
jgi:hypothetical protein